MPSIQWKKAIRNATWIGSTGDASFAEREAFIISRVKPPHVPPLRIARILKKEWHYEYTLMARTGTRTGIAVRRIGCRYPSLEAAKQAAASFLQA